MEKISLSILLLVLFFNAGCKEEENIPVSCVGIHFEYEGEHGPSHWGELCEGYASCDGTVQSPIDIVGATVDNTLSAINHTYTSSATHMLNNGHTVQFTYDSGSSITLNGTTYNLLQFHFHTASEHHVGGASYPMEVHLVHKDDVTGNLAVIGILFEEGAENPLLQTFLSHLPQAEDDTYEAADTYDVSSFLPADTHYYTYSGSLTTPPCSEIVTWIVMKEPIVASLEQVHAFEDIMHENNRPVQDLHGRSIREF